MYAELKIPISLRLKMKTTFIFLIGKWLRRLVMAFMLGFSNVLNQETRMIDDTFFRTEQTSEDKDKQ